MAKNWFGLNPANLVTANGSPGGIRPMPRPGGLAGMEVEQAPRQGFFGPMTDERYEMGMQFLQNAMSAAQGSQSPAISFLTPFLSAVVGGRMNAKRDQAQATDQMKMTEGLLGQPMNEQARKALEVLNNPNAPDYLKDIARTMFKDSMAPLDTPKPRSGGGGRARSSGGGGARPPRLTYISRDPDGVIRGYNAATGKRERVPNADEPAASPAAPTPTNPAPPPLPPLPPDPMLPSDPGGSEDDDLINKYLGR